MAKQITQTGVNIATSATSANSAMPNNSAGVPARFVRIAATAAAYVRMGVGVQTAVSTDLLIQPGDSLIVSTSGANNIAALQVAAAGVVVVTPLEDWE